MRIANLKIAAHLRTIVVVPALTRFQVEPDAWFAQIDVDQLVDVRVDLLLEGGGQPPPVRIVAMAIKLRMANGHAAGTAIVAIEDG